VQNDWLGVGWERALIIGWKHTGLNSSFVECALMIVAYNAHVYTETLALAIYMPAELSLAT
jgi:hypothetical protein